MSSESSGDSGNEERAASSALSVTKPRRTKRKIVMRIEYGGGSSSSDDDSEPLPSSSGARRPSVVSRTKLHKRQMQPHMVAASSSSSKSDFDPQPGPSTVTVPTVPEEYSDHSVWEEDWISDGEEGKAKADDGDGNSSDSSSMSTHREKCPICLFSFTNQEVGRPETCDHKFCAICIDEWAKNVSTCPIDRKEFLRIICLENFHSKRVTREIMIDLSKKMNLEEIIEVDEEITTNCEICGHSDREETMLLCDGCNHGYHMECLSPPLSEIPAGFWYCDDCFGTDDEEGTNADGTRSGLGLGTTLQEEIAELLDEVREIGIPETRLRIRTEESPRIPRTRQSERIRMAILARTNRRGFRDEVQRADSDGLESVAMPGPSLMMTSARIVREISTRTSSSTTTRTRRTGRTTTTTRRRRHRRRVNRKTVVVEYDVDNDDDKFAVQTKKIYKKIKRRTKKKRRKKTQKSRCADRSASSSSTYRLSNNELSRDELAVHRLRAGIPKLMLTGSRNDLDYILSDEADEIDGVGGADEHGDGGLGLVTRARPYNHLANIRNVKRTKAGLIIPESSLSTTTDLLGSIMEEQERWLTISNRENIQNIKIRPDGSLEYQGTRDKQKNKDKARQRVDTSAGDNVMTAAAVTNTGAGEAQRPMNAPGGSDTNATAASRVPATAAAESSATANVSNYSNNTNNSNSGSSNSNDNNRIGLPYRTAGAKKVLPEDTNQGDKNKKDKEQHDREKASSKDGGPSAGGSRISNNNKSEPLENSSDDDCPNFSVYSAETMALAKNISEEQEVSQEEEEEGKEKASAAQAQESGMPGEEREEDLVQLDDDEDDEDGNAPLKCDDEPQEKPPIDESNTDGTGAGKGSLNGSGSNKKCELELYEDSDWDEWNNEKSDEEKSEKVKQEEAAAPAKVSNKSSAERTDSQLNTESISDDEGDELAIGLNEIPSRRSLTPCLDEKQPDCGEEHLEEDLELISDDEIGCTNDINTPAGSSSKAKREDKCAEEGNKGASQSSDKKAEEEFKKLSRNTKERNYRDKERSASPSSSGRRKESDQRKESRRKEDASRRNKRKDLERYDVRNLIAERQPRSQKDKYGRDAVAEENPEPANKSRRRSRSRSSSSLSSLSLIESRTSRSRSNSRSGRKRRRSLSPRKRDKRSPRSKRADRTPPKRHISPAKSIDRRRQRRSPSRFTMSPSPTSRSPTPTRKKDARDAKRGGESSKREAYGLKNGRDKRSRRERYVSPEPTSKRRNDSVQSRSNPRARRSSRSSWSPEPQEQRTHHSPRRHDLVDRNTDNLDESWTPPPPLSTDVSKRTASNYNVVVLKSANAVKDTSSLSVSKKKDKRSKKRKSDKTKREPEEVSSSSKKEKRSKKRLANSQSLSVTTSSLSTAGPSKEVFASGDNILVSVNFKDAAPKPQQTTIVTLPPTKEQIITQKKRNEQREQMILEQQRARRKQGKRRTTRSETSPDSAALKRRRNKKVVDAKPVAIIDLDRSPFKEMTPSPKAVIILSDSDQETTSHVSLKKKSNEGTSKGPPGGVGGDSKKEVGDKQFKGQEPVKVASVNLTLNDDDDDSSFSIELLEATGPKAPAPALSQLKTLANVQGLSMATGGANNMGPKTPPEPVVKFSMAVKSKMTMLRTVNPLHDAREEEELEKEEQQQMEQQASQKLQKQLNLAQLEAELGGKLMMVTDKSTTAAVVGMDVEENQSNSKSTTAGLLVNSGTITAAAVTATATPSSTTGGSNTINTCTSNSGTVSTMTTTAVMHSSGTSNVNNNNVKNNSGISASGGGNNNNNSSSIVNSKVGPNTPPEPAPSSPDVYDPFEPTKSNSQSPSHCGGGNDADDDIDDDDRDNDGPESVSRMDASMENSSMLVGDSVDSTNLVMKLLNSQKPQIPLAMASNQVHHLSDTSGSGLSPPILPPPPPQFHDKNDGDGMGGGITILSNVLLQSGKTLNDVKRLSNSGIFKKSTGTSLATGANASTANPVTIPPLTQAMLRRHNAEIALKEMAESPYSPGSSDFDDLFEPPQDPLPVVNEKAAATGSYVHAQASRIISPMKPAFKEPVKNQAELFDSLFGSSSPPQQMTSSQSWNPITNHGHRGQASDDRGYRKSVNHKRPSIDDVPSSAMELLIQDRYLKKLNRQERVVEEVKHVLKPHYQRKHITKEDYKEIMRKSVPKICHSRSGEINPIKIQALVEAYVKKYRYTRKYGGSSAAARPENHSSSSTITNQNKNNANVNSKPMWT